MRAAIPTFVLALNSPGCDRAQQHAGPSTASPHEVAIPAAPAAASPTIDFATQVRPILQTRCQPCHFPGGKMYQRLPFDREETIKALGTKLFSRIEDEKERRIIADFLSQP